MSRWRLAAVIGRPPAKFFCTVNIQPRQRKISIFTQAFLKCKTAKVELTSKFPKTKNCLAQTNKGLGFPHFFCALKIHNLHFKKATAKEKQSAEKSEDSNTNRLSYNVLALGARCRWWRAEFSRLI
jgi:hypothetical protein